MVGDHPDDDHFRAGHGFCFAHSAGALLQVLRQSSRCRVLIPHHLIEDVAPFEADDPPAAPANPGAPAPSATLAADLSKYGMDHA